MNIKWVVKALINPLIIRFYSLYRKSIEKKKCTHISKKASVKSPLVFEGDNYVSSAIISNCFLGKMIYIGDGSNIANMRVRCFSSIAPNCSIVFGVYHSRDVVSTYPAFYSKEGTTGSCLVNEFKFKELWYVDEDDQLMCSIGNNVWLISNVTILADTIGVRRHKLRTVVIKDIPDDGIWADIPEKLIKRLTGRGKQLVYYLPTLRREVA